MFTSSFDGSFSFLKISDKDPRKKDAIPQVQITSEIMIPKINRETIIR
jgi:hypothetical protein